MDLGKDKVWDERLQLARLEKEDFTRIGLLVGALSLIFLMFHFQGNSSDAGRWGRSAFVWMYLRWSDSGIAMGGSGDYSHGFLVPIASALVIWLKKDELLRVDKSVTRTGLALVIFCLLAHYLGAKAQQTRLSLLAMVGLTWCIPLYLYGWSVARILLFPCSFLIFALPLNFLDQMTFPLRMVNTNVAVAVLEGLNFNIKQVGTAILGPPYDQTAELQLDVADPCSGVRSLTAMMALTAVYGFFVMKGFWRKWALFVISVPLAMIGNMFRITSLVILANAFGSKVATTLIHDYSGYVVFGVAIALMVATSFVLNQDFGALWKKLRRALGNASI